MEFVQNLPFFGIVAALLFGVICSVLKKRGAEVLTLLLLAAEVTASCLVLMFTIRTGKSYVFMMGHFPAPWGNDP